MRRSLVVHVLLSATVSILAIAGDTRTVISGPSTIESVTVYQNRSMITRLIPGDVLPGLYTWQFLDLPAQLLEESVRVSGRGTAAAKILDIRIQRSFSSESVQNDVKNLEKKVQEVENQLQEVADHLEVLNKKSELVRGLSVLKAADEKPGAAALSDSADDWRKRLDFIDSQLTRILEQTRQRNLEKKELEKKRALLRSELSQLSSHQAKEKKVILVDVDVTKAGTERLAISYVVPGVSWTPCYDLRIDSQKNEALLTYQAFVTQTTGEDWQDVQLSLSTAEPAIQSRPRQLQAWLVNTADSQLGAITCLISDGQGYPLPGVNVSVTSDVFHKSAASNNEGRAQFLNLKPGTYALRAELAGFKTTLRPGIEVRAGRSARLNVEMEVATLEEQVTVSAKVQYAEIGAVNAPSEAAEKDTDIETSEATDRTVASVFTIKQPQTVPSSSEKKKVTIAVEVLPVEKEYVSTPKLAENVSLIAKVTNTAVFSLLPGSASLFYDADYVSTAPIPPVSANDHFSVSVGEVPGIKVQWRLLGKTRTETGLVGKKVQLTYDIAITFESLLRTSQTVTVKDQIPITTSKDVTIDILQVAPEPLKKTLEEGQPDDGILSWSITLPPLEKKVISLKFRITHPKNRPLIDGRD
jgi:hypothetical protein